MAPDFSYLKRLPVESYAKWIENGHPMTEEMFTSALAVIDPPLLPNRAMAALLRELDVDARRKRGRPLARSLSRRRLAEMIERQVRGDVPAIFISALLERLRSGRRLTDRMYSVRSNRGYHSRRRDMLIRILYREFYESPVAKSELAHPIMGSFPLSPEQRAWSKSHLALELTHKVIRDVFGYNPPSLGTLLNVVSGRKYQPRS
ncbi:hypothetical protein [Allosphingosinicella sp.]|uniref:hypothetical protein n=1 Tax=Allosphingosinicella sp. TaxID=2823234 RepID=UPI003783DCE0